jgi:hypothetical protein
VNTVKAIAQAMALVVGEASAAQTPALPSSSLSITYHRAIVDGVGIFYREAGPKDAPTIVLLHGFPSSKRDLPDAEVHILDAGHFALDEKVDEIAALMLVFLGKHA